MKNTIIVLFIFYLFGCSNRKANSQIEESKPNILFIAVDDLNDWIGVMKGHPNAKTPNLDKLAKRGVLFTNAHCQAPLCGPSRTSVMTGLRPSSTGIYGMIKDDLIKNNNEVTKDIIFLPEYFKNHGYHTMGIGKLFHTHAPKGVFDESGGRVKGFGPLPKERFVWDGDGTKTKNYGSTSTDWGAFPEADSLMPDYKSTQWAIERLGRAYKKPFFMGIGYLRPHVPLYVPQKWFDMHPIESIVTPPYKADDFSDIPDVGLKINDLPMMPSTQWAIENGEWKKIIQAYLASISFVDHQVGDVIKALESSEHANNTIVLLWSDHGYRMGEKNTFAKHCLWEEATNAPLMISGLDLPKDKDIDMPVEMLSIYPTLLELCGLPPYNRNEGESLVKYIRQNVHYKRAVAITTFGMQNHSIRSENYRYIQYEDGSEELYDHKKDPNEWYNLASLEEFKSIKEELKAFLPTVNVKWTTHSSYKFQPYFVEQKERMLKNNQK